MPSSKRSRVHPPFKTKYRVTNWPDYDRALASRGDLTIWMSPRAIKSWRAWPTKRRCGQPLFSNLAIETALTLRVVYGLPLRQTEDFIRSIFRMMDIDLEAPDHTTLSRGSKTLRTRLKRVPTSEPITLILDSSGLAISGEGPWAASKDGMKTVRGWKELHLAVDQNGVIQGRELTSSTTHDAVTGSRLLRRSRAEVAEVIGDGAYDARHVYEQIDKLGAVATIPPTKKANPARRAHPLRKRTIEWIGRVGRRCWKRDAGYHRQAKVENACFRYKLNARHPRAQATEASIACNILNKMIDLGRPESVAIK